MSLAQEVSCTVTAFGGSESQILRLRNANRERPETLEYLRWRYERPPDCPEPCVYWLLSNDAECIGMASAIFRPYFLDGRRQPVAVIGDISLDASWRGRGLGRALLRFMTSHLAQHYPDHAALVIPTESARRALDACGWRTAGTLSPMVYVLEPASYLKPLLGSAGLANALAATLRSWGRGWVSRYVPRAGELQFSNSLAGLSGPHPAQVAPAGIAVRDQSAALLEWRYARHPHTRFTFATLQDGGSVKALLVFEDCTLDGSCTIYDLLAETAEDLRALVALFVLHTLRLGRFTTLRAALDAQHPARSGLRRLGFVSRPDDAVFQVHSSGGVADGLKWRLSQGDKDT
jgi:GNAT superfamily N-acetyltransferase